MNKFTVRFTVNDRQYEYFDVDQIKFFQLFEKYIKAGDFAFEGYDNPVEDTIRRKEYQGSNDIMFEVKKAVESRLHEYGALNIIEDIYKLVGDWWNNNYEMAVLRQRNIERFVSKEFLSDLNRAIYALHKKHFNLLNQ